MARPKVHIYSVGAAAVLQSAGAHRLVDEATERIAAEVRDMNITVGDREGGPREYELPVTTSMTTTDRAHGRVTLAHPAGQAVQAKHGALTKAADSIGADVKVQ